MLSTGRIKRLTPCSVAVFTLAFFSQSKNRPLQHFVRCLFSYMVEYLQELAKATEFFDIHSPLGLSFMLSHHSLEPKSSEQP